MNTFEQATELGSAQKKAETMTPEQVLAADWDTSHKIEVLEKMEVDAKALLRASSEGMGGGETPHLKAIEDAIEEVKSSR